MLTAAEIIRLLDLKPHPEGGHYRQTFRDSLTYPAPQAGQGRVGAARAPRPRSIFCWRAASDSHWHRVDAVEIWHWHAGAPLELEIAAASGPRERIMLGNDLAAGERPQGIVPAHAWQAARSLGDWTLVGCTVAPGFEFATFELAPPDWEPKS